MSESPRDADQSPGKLPLKAVLMAGGEGSRLRPLTTNRPKPLVPICNEPIMAHILALVKRHGVKEVVATVCYMSEEIVAQFGDGVDWDVNLTYSFENVPLGTAGSVKKAESLLKDGTFIIISGDALTDCDLTAAVEFHRQKKSVATLVLYRVPNPLEFGVVITNEEGRVERFLEKPSASEVFSDTVNTGIYVLDPKVFDFMEPDKPYDWSADVFPKLLDAGLPVFGFIMDGYWTDVGSLAQYREAQEHLMTGRVALPLPQGKFENGIFVGQNCRIDDSAVLIPPLCIGRNCTIKQCSRIGPYTVIGDNSLIEESAHVERSVLWDSVYIGPGAGIHSAVICSRATVKRDSVVREDAVVGDRCLIDINSTVRPKVRLWPDKVIERGSTVTMSLVWGSRWRGSLFRDLGVGGLSNLEITPEFACRLGSAFGSCFPPHSTIVTSRDSTRSSRMIKRAVVSSLLSVGCEVLDLQSLAVPVARHFVRANQVDGAMNVRKLPGNARVTLVEMLDPRGSYLDRPIERKVESAFFREDFRRTDPDDLGQIIYAPAAIEQYEVAFLAKLDTNARAKRFRVICDYGHSSLASFFPGILEKLGIDSISINSFSDAKKAPRTQAEVDRHIRDLTQIVGTLGYDLGVLFNQEGELLQIVDDRGNSVLPTTLFAVLALLIKDGGEPLSVAMTISAPSSLERLLESRGIEVIRTKAGTRALMSTALDTGVALAGDNEGGFIFADMHPGFDAPFTFCKLVQLLRASGTSFSDAAYGLPPFAVVYEQVHVPWESKGTVMRKISEQAGESSRVETVDGIKIFNDEAWVLILPDAVEPMIHIYAETGGEESGKALATDYVRRIAAMTHE